MKTSKTFSKTPISQLTLSITKFFLFKTMILLKICLPCSPPTVGVMARPENKKLIKPPLNRDNLTHVNRNQTLSSLSNCNFDSSILHSNSYNKKLSYLKQKTC